MHFSPHGLGCCPLLGGGSVVVVFLLIYTPIVEVCNCSMFCCTLLYVHSSFAIILMGKRELIALLKFSSWCLVIVVWLLLAVPWVCLRFVIVVFPDHTHYFYSLLQNRTWPVAIPHSRYLIPASKKTRASRSFKYQQYVPYIYRLCQIQLLP